MFRRYFGAGFDSHECGITIANAQNADKSQWKCLMGVEQNGKLETLGAIVDASALDASKYDIEVDDVYGMHQSQVNILCRTNFPAEYCWFRHASGRKIPLSDHRAHQEPELAQYRYFGNGVRLGECGVTIMSATVNDTGTWSCHMGTIAQSGVEQTKEINVRISGWRAHASRPGVGG